MCKNQGKYKSREHESKLHCIMLFPKSSQSKQTGTLFVVCFLLGNSWGITQKKSIQRTEHGESLKSRYVLSPSGLHIGPVYTFWYYCWKRTINHTPELVGCAQHNSPTCAVRYGILVGILRNCFTARGQCDNHILSSISSPSFDCILLPWKIHLTFKCFPNWNQNALYIRNTQKF